MKVAIVGGGPSGLYLALLLRARMPDAEVHVIEQNALDATYGFGVVLAETGLEQLRDADAESYEAMVAGMRFNYSQDLVHRDVAINVVRKVRGGAIGRLELLQALVAICRKRGVVLHHGRRIANTADLASLALDDADLVVGADGANSVVRTEFHEEFGTHQYRLTNHFAWYGTRRVFETPALVFRKYGVHGHCVAHYYPYGDTMSTFVAECDHATWEREGFAEMSDDARREAFEALYSAELRGMPLISNKSVWQQFQVTLNEHWHVGRHVLIGDAPASAHPSIGSGTRIAMTDSIALSLELARTGGSMEEKLEAYERTHRPQKVKLIAASERSFRWYEDVAKWMAQYTPEQFVYSFMTRTGRIDDARLRADFPGLIERLGMAA